jgi:hypothetical protein
MRFVPPGRRDAKIPCRHIPLDTVGETLDRLYRYADQNEIEAAVREWLQATISKLEQERGCHKRADKEATYTYKI